LIDRNLVPPDYQPVFESTKLLPIVEKKPYCGESSHGEQVKQLREIVVLLKCLIVVCGLVLVSNLYAIARSE
jgi:hypothetical protein